MKRDTVFAERIRNEYPMGLTGIFAVGGTRTSYILEQKAADTNDPGAIQDFDDYAKTLALKYMELITNYLNLGGQNLIIPVLSYQSFVKRGSRYSRFISESTLALIDDEFISFYNKNYIDPYFVGIDTLNELSAESTGYHLSQRLAAFQDTYPYQDGRHKLIWEIAPIPLFTFFNMKKVVGEQVWKHIQNELESTQDLQSIHDILYRHYSKEVYGTEIPNPHFYIGSNRNGDLKLRSMMPVSLLCGSDFRMYFLPYPSLLMSQETLKTIIEDLTFGERMRSFDQDYSGKYDVELVKSEYERIMQLSSDPLSTIGLTRQYKRNSEE